MSIGTCVCATDKNHMGRCPSKRARRCTVVVKSFLLCSGYIKRSFPLCRKSRTVVVKGMASESCFDRKHEEVDASEGRCGFGEGHEEGNTAGEMELSCIILIKNCYSTVFRHSSHEQKYFAETAISSSLPYKTTNTTEKSFSQTTASK